MSVVSVTNDNFETLINEPGVKLVRFWASWCSPCMMMAPIYKKVAEKIGETARFCEVNVDLLPRIANSHSIRSIPTVVVYKNGEIVSRTSGMMNENELIMLVNSVSVEV